MGTVGLVMTFVHLPKVVKATVNLAVAAASAVGVRVPQM